MRRPHIQSGKTIILLILLSFLMVQCRTNLSSSGDLEAGFKNPAIENRPLAFWDWLNGYVDTAKLVYELEEMKAKGMQGAFIWDVGALADPDKTIPVGPAFLGEQSLEYISLALNTAERLGLKLGMIASSSWNAGGDWIDAADASKELLSSSQLVQGPAKRTIIIGKPDGLRAEANPCRLISSIAIPYSSSKQLDHSTDKIILLDEFTSENKIIDWAVPEGEWEVISFFSCNTGQNLACPSPNSNGFMIDHLSRQATKIHFDTIITRLATVSTPENQLKFLEVDSYEVWPMKDWSPNLLAEFRTRYQYDPVPFMPLLRGYHCEDSIVGERFLGDYSRLVSDMMIENHFAQAAEISNENGMQLFAEAGHGGYPRVDPLKAFGYSDVPMGEFWNRRRHWVTKEAASAAHIYGKMSVASESLTGWNHWQHGPTDFKQLCDMAFCEGLNQIFFHTFAHNPEIAGKPGNAYHAGEHINVNTTWWDMARPFMDYLSRCSFMLRQGNFVGDACLYYGDQAPNLVPPKRIDPNITPIFGEGLCLHCGQPIPVIVGELPGYDYDYINADVITNILETENGKLVLPSGQSYRVMLLPDRPDISFEVLKRIEQLVAGGAVVIGPKPERTTSLKGYPECDDEVKRIADNLWGEIDGEKIFSNEYGKGKVYWGMSVKEVLEKMEVGPDFKVEGIDNRHYTIDYIHRQTENEDIYFVANSSQKTEQVTCTFRVEADRVPELWDAETGFIQRVVDYTKTSGGIQIELVMHALSSRFVVFKNTSARQNDAGLSYNLQYGFDEKSDTTINEVIDISKNWNIKFDSAMGGPRSHQADQLISWTDMELDGVRYYSGTANYTKEFTIQEGKLTQDLEVHIAFEDIQEMARVVVNGQDCGIVWVPPYRAAIGKQLKSGRNEIMIQVTNNWNNRIVGDLRNPEGRVYTKTNAKSKFNANSPLLKSGLMGKAELIFSKNN